MCRSRPPLVCDTRQQRGRHVVKNEWFRDHGVETLTRKMDFGDYMYGPSNIVVDTKRDVQELAMDCGKDHRRFAGELDRAAASGYRLYILVEEHPEYADRRLLAGWLTRMCRYCRHRRRGLCDPLSTDGGCLEYRRKPLNGPTLAKIVNRLEIDHGARFAFCSKRDTARVICDLLGVPYE